MHIWKKLYACSKLPAASFLAALDVLDTQALTHLDPNDPDFENNLEGGLVEKDFRSVLEKEDLENRLTRIAFLLNRGEDLKVLRQRLGDETFLTILGTALIQGRYESHGIQFEKLLAQTVKQYNLDKRFVIDISFLRGMHTGKPSKPLLWSKNISNFFNSIIYSCSKLFFIILKRLNHQSHPL